MNREGECKRGGVTVKIGNINEREKKDAEASVLPKCQPLSFSDER